MKLESKGNKKIKKNFLKNYIIENGNIVNYLWVVDVWNDEVDKNINKKIRTTKVIESQRSLYKDDCSGIDM